MLSRTIHTLGPAGTNCEKAGYLWLKNNNFNGDVILYSTLEEALVEVKKNKQDLLLGCAVYPDLHHIVFKNLIEMEIKDSFVMPTWNMVLAVKDKKNPLTKESTISSHPAPAHLASLYSENVMLVNSNVQAALECVNGNTGGCITTLKAVEENGLHIIEDFGEVPMCFTIHGHRH